MTKAEELEDAILTVEAEPTELDASMPTVLAAARAHLSALQSDPGEDLAALEQHIDDLSETLAEYECQWGGDYLAEKWQLKENATTAREAIKAALSRLRARLAPAPPADDFGDVAAILAVLRVHGSDHDRAAFDRLSASLALRESDDARAERLLGDWLVENQGWGVFFDDLAHNGDKPILCQLSRVASTGAPALSRSAKGTGPTRAAAILAALEKAGVKTEGS